MQHWYGFETARNVAQIYETTITDAAPDLPAHFARVIRLERPPLSADSRGNTLTARCHNEAGYVYHEESKKPWFRPARSRWVW